MFTRKLDTEDPLLDKEIERLLSEIKTINPLDDEYPKMLDQLSKLYKLKPEKPKPVSNDTLAIIAGNVACVVLIVGYERANLVTSKALGFVMKLR